MEQRMLTPIRRGAAQIPAVVCIVYVDMSCACYTRDVMILVEWVEKVVDYDVS